jgi:hypothetical protein
MMSNSSAVKGLSVWVFLSNAEVLQDHQLNESIGEEDRASPCGWVIHSLQEFVQLISTSRFEDFFTVNIVPDVRQIVIPMKWYVSDTVWCLERK